MIHSSNISPYWACHIYAIQKPIIDIDFSYIPTCCYHLMSATIAFLCAKHNTKARNILKHIILKAPEFDDLKIDYCIEICDDPDIWKALAKSTRPESAQWQYLYCKYVKDRPEMWRALARHSDPMTLEWKFMYCRYVKDRDEFHM